MLLNQILEDLRRFDPKPTGGYSSERARAITRGLLSPGFSAILVYRIFHWVDSKGLPSQPVRFLTERFVEVSAGISIPARSRIGPGLRIHHFGGIMLHPNVRIGRNCTLYHNVTLGADGQSEEAPTIGDDVLIGAGAKVLGGIKIGNRCRIGANAVVVRSCPDDAVMVGIPARNVKSS